MFFVCVVVEPFSYVAVVGVVGIPLPFEVVIIYGRIRPTDTLKKFDALSTIKMECFWDFCDSFHPVADKGAVEEGGLEA